MSVTYDTIEVINPADDLPTWSTVFVGVDGCLSKTVYFGTPTTFTNCPANSKAVYEPYLERITKSRPENGRRKGYPPYRFTPYSIVKTTQEQYLVKRHHGSNGLNRWTQQGFVGRVGSSCVAQVTSTDSTGPIFPEYNTVTHDFGANTTYTIHGFDSTELSVARSAAINDAVKDAMTSLDLLTEIAEARELPKLVTSASSMLQNILGGLQSRFGKAAMRSARHIRPIDLLKHPDKVLRNLGDAWMMYRYGIMPLVYSYRDAVKLSKRGQCVTSRGFQSVSPKSINVSLPGPTSTFNRVRIEGTQTYRATVFQFFTSQEVSRLSGLGINPLVTAWELIPYSFVVDWFLNVGDYISARCGTTFAQKKWACLSHRSRYSIITEVHLPNQDDIVSISNKLPTNWVGPTPPANPNITLDNPEGYFPFRKQTVDSYSRTLIDVGYAPLTYKPSLNWKRLVDSAVMSLSNLRSFFRRI